MFKTKKKLYVALERADKIICEQSIQLESLKIEYKKTNDELVDLKNSIATSEKFDDEESYEGD